MFATRVQVRSPLVANRSRRAVRMAPAAVMDDVREVIAEQLGFDLEKVTPEAEFEKDLEADSLDTVEIMMALEEKFDITIEGAATDGIEKVSDVTNIIEKIQSGEIVVPAEKSDEAAPAAEAKAAPAAEAKAAPAAEAKEA